jgi:PTH1 family peptidyl-tRNA hydrolase
MSMDFWKIRYRNKGSAGGHNGIKNMIKYFGEDFKRLKVWIWKDDRYEVSDWVLSKFSWAERDKFDEIFEKTKEIIREKL